MIIAINRRLSSSLTNSGQLAIIVAIDCLLSNGALDLACFELTMNGKSSGGRMSLVQEYIEGLNNCLKELLKQNIEAIADIILDACKKGKQVLIMGNGGSATTASHFARDLRIGAAVEGKPRIQATSLTDNPALITAIANDKGYSYIFEEQLIGQINEGNVVIGISASGNSSNILRAVEFARGEGAITIGVTGFGGGKLKELAHKCVILSSKDYRQVEDAHLCLAHIISYLVKEKITNGK